MKRIFNILFFALLALVFTGCEKESEWGNGGKGSNNVDIPISVGDYITFWTDVRTRADLVTTKYLEQDFGVFCYMYDFTNSWGAYKISAKPTTAVLNKTDIPTQVTYADGAYSYGEVASWGTNRYAFFAYAPYGRKNIVDPSAPTVEGTPYVTYTLDTANSANHADIMTGYAADCYSALSKDVTFRMWHRLAAVDVAAVNYYDYSYASGSVDSEGNAIYNTEKVQIEINSITAKFNNLKYGSAKIYLDRNMATVPTALSSGTKPSYPIGEYDLAYSASSEFDYISVNNKTTMLLIPQEDATPEDTSDDLSIEVVVNYKKKRPDNTYLQTVVETVEENDNGKIVQREYKVDVPAGSDTTGIDPNPDANGDIKVIGPDFTTTQIATFDRSLKEMYRYYALLTFTSHAVSINIITSAEWTENKVEHEFD